MQTKSSTTLKNAIDLLFTKYPNGIKPVSQYSYGYRVPAQLLNHDEVKILLEASNNNLEQFKQLLSNDPTYQEIIRKRNENLLNSWFTQINKSNIYRNKKAAQVESDRIERERKKKRDKKSIQAWREKEKAKRIAETDKRRKAAKIAQAKAKKKEALWKQLNLSKEQKTLLRQLAE